MNECETVQTNLYIWSPQVWGHVGLRAGNGSSLDSSQADLELHWLPSRSKPDTHWVYPYVHIALLKERENTNIQSSFTVYCGYSGFSFHTHMLHSSALFFCPSVVWTIWWTVVWAQLDSQTWALHMTHNQSPLGAQSHMDPLCGKKHKVRS